MRILGLDVGDRRIGIALSDALGITAQPFAVLERTTLARDCDRLAEIVRRRQVERAIVGLPLTMSGIHGKQARKVEGFARALRRRISVPVHLLDERFTTMQGKRVLSGLGKSAKKQKPIIDQIAAQLILQSYLEANIAANTTDANQ